MYCPRHGYSLDVEHPTPLKDCVEEAFREGRISVNRYRQLLGQKPLPDGVNRRPKSRRRGCPHG